MNIFTRVKQSALTLLLLFLQSAFPNTLLAQEGLLNTYAVIIETIDNDAVYGPYNLTVVPGFPARVSISGAVDHPDIEVRVLTNPYPLKTGGAAVQVDLMVLRKTDDHWAIIGEPRMILRVGEAGMSRVDTASNSLEVNIEINEGTPIKG